MDHQKIELRSEKVRSIVGKVPPLLMRSGICIVSIMLVVVLIGSFFFHYPETISGEIRLFCKPDTRLVIAPADGLLLFPDEIYQSKSCEKGEFVACLASTTHGSFIELKAPISGTLIINKSGSENVMAGDILFAIEPDSTVEVFGIMNLPYTLKYKLKEGQEATIELQNERGIRISINGEIKEIYPIQFVENQEKCFRLKVVLSSNRTNLGCIGETEKRAKATIIISNQRLFNKLIGLK